MKRIRTVGEAILPGLAFTIVVLLRGSLAAAIVVAVSLTVAFTVWRFTGGEKSARPLIGVALLVPAVLAALLSGSAVNFFLPDIILMGSATVVALLMQLAGVPPVGVLVSVATGSSMDWRRCSRRRRAYSGATAVLLVAVFLLIGIQVPLYLSGSVAALGVARLGQWPVNGLSFTLAFWVYRRMIGDHVCEESELTQGAASR
jgi:hypothetical protein